jgi:hypothetical protein
MSRLEQSFKIFSKQGVKFLLLELVVVFLGVYLAFLFQSYSENQKLKSEKEKIMIGLKDDLEYFRIFFPGLSSGMKGNIAEWEDLIKRDTYRDFSSWRFIQPQYDYAVIEYALNADAEVIDFEMNSDLSKLYTELEKLRQAEELITEIALNYKAVPPNLERTPEVQLIHANNLLNLERLKNRAIDRVGIMDRISELSTQNLIRVNEEFSDQKRKEIELLLISKRDLPDNEQEKQFYFRVLKRAFPDLSDEEIKEVLKID